MPFSFQCLWKIADGGNELDKLRLRVYLLEYQGAIDDYNYDTWTQRYKIHFPLSQANW